MALSLSGLASGLDSAALITQLMEVERAPRTRLALDQVRAEARKTALQGVADRLATLRTAAEGLRSATTWADTQAVASSDPTRVAVTRTAGAGPGGYEIAVDRLASAEQRTYAHTPSDTATTLTVGSLTVDVPAGATADEIARILNAQADGPVYAAAIGDGAGGRALVLSARTTGTTSGFQASGATIVEDGAKARPGTDLEYRLDGESATRTSTTNTLKDVLPGLELTVRGVTTGTSIVVEPPKVAADAVAAKLQAFVDAYNGLTDYVRAKTSEKVVPGATTAAGVSQGVLFGDRTLSGLLTQLRGAVATPVGGTGNPSTLDQLAELGVGTAASTGGLSSPAALAGRLSVDRTTLDAALTADPLAARRLLGATSGVDGLSQRLDALLGTGGATGLMTSRLESSGSDLQRISSSITAMDARLTQREARYKAQFAALETALSRAQTQQSWLSGQLAGLSSS